MCRNVAGRSATAPGIVVHSTVGGGVTAARGPLESQVEVRNLAPEQPRRNAGETNGWKAGPGADPTVVDGRRGGAGSGRRHPHALGDAQGAPPALRTADAPPRARRARAAPAPEDRRGGRPRRRARHQDAARATCRRRAGRVRRAAHPAGHGRCRQRGAHRLRRRSRRRGRPHRGGRRRAAAAGGDARPPRHRAPPRRRRRVAAHRPGRRPHRVRPDPARRPGPGRADRRAVRRHSRRARDRRGQPLDLLLPSRLARARAPAAQSGERPGRVLPHRRRRGAAPGRTHGARGRGRRRHRRVRRQRPRPAGRGRSHAAAPHQPPRGCARASA